MNIKDLNVYILGDSIAYIGDSWSYKLASMIDCNSVYVLARGGATWGNRYDYQAYDKNSFIWNNPFKTIKYDDRTEGYPANYSCLYNVLVDCAANNQISNQIVFMDRLVNEFNRPYPDVIIISCGINDTNNETEVFDEDLFNGIVKRNDISLDELRVMEYGINYCLKELKNKYPNSKIIVISPIPSNYSFLRPYIPNTELWLKSFCEYYDVSYIDGYNCGINPDNEAGKDDTVYIDNNPGVYLYDGLHPNKEGFKVLSDYFSKEIIKILK